MLDISLRNELLSPYEPCLNKINGMLVGADLSRLPSIYRPFGDSRPQLQLTITICPWPFPRHHTAYRESLQHLVIDCYSVFRMLGSNVSNMMLTQR